MYNDQFVTGVRLSESSSQQGEGVLFMISPKFSELKAMTEDEIERLYDQVSVQTVVGLDFLLNELLRRNGDRKTNAMLEYTRRIWVMTAIVGSVLGRMPIDIMGEVPGPITTSTALSSPRHF